MSDLWPHQAFGIQAVCGAILDGARRLCLTSPTGGGKTRMMEEIIKWAVNHGGVALHSDRKMLIDQVSADLVAARIDHGVRAAGHDEDLSRPVQICSVQTEVSRVLKRGSRMLHECRLAIFDEGHRHAQGQVLELRKRYLAAGATTLDITATPLGMFDICDQLIIAGTNSELRACGALVPAIHYGPDEPDLREFKRDNNAPLENGEDLSVQQLRKLYPQSPVMFGRLWENFNRLNPDHRPTVCFGPSVECSIWIAEQFTKKGVPFAHIDGDDIWVDGKLYRNTDTLREEVLARNESGDIVGISNRYVLREGINCPWWRHAILCTITGSLQTYLQAGGRVLRSHPDKSEAIFQDHGGNYWRHGSLNEDRDWHLDWTSRMAYEARADRARRKIIRQPFVCPGCSRVWIARRVCECGFELEKFKPSRPIVTTDGTMKHLSANVFQPHRICQQPNGAKLWERMYYRAKSERWNATFRQAFAKFAEENRWAWPDPTWPLMPKEHRDEFRRVRDVPVSRLTGVPVTWNNRQTAEAAGGLFTGSAVSQPTT